MYAGSQVARRALAKFLVAQPVPATHPFAAAFGRRTTPRAGKKARNLRVYDGQPVHDQEGGANAAMGIMNGKEALDR